MKRRTIALILCGAMMMSGLPVSASDFESVTDGSYVDDPNELEAETEDEGLSEEGTFGDLEESQAEDGQEDLSQDPAEADSEEEPAAMEEAEGQSAEDTPAVDDAQDQTQEEIPTDGGEQMETDVDGLAASEKPVDFGTEELVLTGMDSGYTRRADEVFVSDWEYRRVGDSVEFRLAETAAKTEEEFLDAMAAADEADAEADAEAAEGEDSFGEISLPEEADTEEEPDGFLPLAESTQEQTAGPESYYTREDGLVHIKTVDEDGNLLTEGTYLFDENGILLTGQQQLSAGLAGYEGETDGLAYFTDEEHAVLLAGADAKEGANPANSDLGQQVKDDWVWTGSVFQYYDAKGDFISVPDLKASARKNADTYTGYFEIHNEKYILKDNGAPRTGDYTLKEGIRPGTYYLYPAENADEIPGRMAVSTWVYLQISGRDRWRYYDGKGRTDVSKKKVKKLDKKLNPAVGDKKYLLNERGYVYSKQTMAKLPSGAYYACNSKGVVYENKLVKISGARYYFGKGGKRATWAEGWHRCSGAGNRFYYFDDGNGKVIEKTGWFRISLGSGKYGWFYFPKNGNHYVNKWAGNKTYYFKKNGALAGGMQTIGDKTYYFTLSDETTHRGQVYKNTLFRSRGEKYYATSSGAIAKSKWVKLNGNYYYFRYNGIMMTNEFVTGPDQKTHGYIDKDGKFTIGWVIVNDSLNQVKYLNPEGRGFLENTAYTIKGVRYYFDSDGYRVPDLTRFNLKNKKDDLLSEIHAGKYIGRYLLEVDKSNGVVCIYVNSSKYGKVPVRSMRTSVGANIDNTPNGTYTVHRWAEWTLLNGPSWGQWGSRVVDGIFMHSIACPEANRYNLNTSAYDMLGRPASQGCIRLCVADAKWAYDNCNGSQITIFTGTYRANEVFKSPLGRKPLVRRYGAGNFDPTDPAIVGNKYY